jgi:SAM-dependent methyltransferase
MPGIYDTPAMDQRAAKGFVSAEDYESYRPSYPAETVAFIRREARLDERSTVVDLAAGTGLMTRLLRPVGRLIAVEPIPQMRAVLARQVPEAEVLAGYADDMPLETACADAVVTAQAFHWFPTAAALREVARVLRPEGAMAIVWNRKDRSDPFMQRWHDRLAPYRKDSPDHETIPWRDAFADPGAPLEIVAEDHTHWEETVTLGHLKGRVLSVSYVALLDRHGRETVMRLMEEVAGSTDDETPVTLKHVTEAYVARHRPGT